MSLAIARPRAWTVFAALAALTILVYWPSLRGGYLFDDRIFVNGTDLHVTSLDVGQWIKAALSQAGTHQLRALTMLSFAANYYFTGLDPFWLKLTNLFIHLLNGWLLFLLVRELLRLRAVVSPDRRGNVATDNVAAAMIAGAWLLLPINLTAVAYISQRVESLANLFVFLGLFWYLRARHRVYQGEGGAAGLWASLLVCTALGLTAKESAALLPLYTAVAEFVLTRFRDRNGAWCRPALLAHVVLLAVPLVAGLVWVSTWAFHDVQSYRPFTTVERLLTEPRVLVDYIQWTLLPSLGSLTFYHDDLAISHGLLDPPTTLLSILALSGLIAVAAWQRRTRPLFCLGVAWYFAGHSMTATIIPLELVFEHRNYFPSAGLLLAVASLVTLEPAPRFALAAKTLAAGFIGLFAFTTFLRAEEWSNPLRLAYAEATKRPHSARAQYELARTLIIAGQGDAESPLIGRATEILRAAANDPASGIAPLQALIYLDGRAHRPVNPEWWQRILARLQDGVPSQTDIDAIIFLMRCQLDGDCPVQKQELLSVFVAALAKSNGNIYLMAAYADFAWRELGDADLAERMARTVAEIRPQVPLYRENLIRTLIATGRLEKVPPELTALERLNHVGELDAEIGTLKSQWQQARQTRDAAKPAPTSPTP